MVATTDFPQADRLLQVGDVATAVRAGQRSDQGIEAAIGLDSNARQGRYYRRAAEILGLITTRQNSSGLTELGLEYTRLGTRSARLSFLARCLTETPVFSSALKYVLAHRPTDKQLLLWFKNFYPGSENTAGRRFSTFI